MTSDELAQRIAELARDASMEMTPGDEALVPALAAELPPGAVVFVAHPPRATFEDVVRTSLRVQACGLAACPHIVARRIDGPDALQAACERLGAAGIGRRWSSLATTECGRPREHARPAEDGSADPPRNHANRRRRSPRRASGHRPDRAVASPSRQAGPRAASRNRSLRRDAVRIRSGRHRRLGAMPPGHGISLPSTSAWPDRRRCRS